MTGIAAKRYEPHILRSCRNGESGWVKCAVHTGASRRLGASALLPSQSDKSGQLAVTNIRILTSHHATILPLYYLMASFSSVPPELLRGIFGLLDHGSLKAVRLVSRYYSLIVEPLIFSVVVFDLDLGGINGLVSIAESPTLRQHVQTIRLHRRSGPKDFGAFEDWHGLTMYVYIGFEGLDDGDPDADRLDSELQDPTKRPMSKHEWEALSDIDRRHLYEDYERERVTLQRHIGGLSALVLSQILGRRSEHPFGTTNDNGDDHSLKLFLQSFEQAIKRLPQLSGFSHQPAHLDESWGTHWRRLRFHRFGVLAMHDVL